MYPSAVTAPPDEFGLSALRTLARVADPAPAPDHSGFWNHFFRALVADRPELAPARELDPSDATVSHTYRSLGGVRIGCRLLTPPADTPVRAGVLVLHGAEVTRTLEQDAAGWAALASRGAAVLLIRLRGYAGSRADTGDLTRPDPHGLRLLGRGLVDPEDTPDATMRWWLAQAVADAADGCRVLRSLLAGRPGPVTLRVDPAAAAHRPVFVSGESLGGGLAVLAASLLAGKLPHERVVHRLVLGLPSLGDWPWRLSTPGFAGRGVGRDVEVALARHPDRNPLIARRLRLFDAVVHAPRVRCPVLCKLAERDEVVPAPAAAGVFNALGADPGEKWRFVVPVGHAEAGLPNARRHALFDRCADRFLDPSAHPAETMPAWEPVLLAGDGEPEDAASPAPRAEPAATGGAQAALFAADAPTDARDRAIVDAYAAAGRTLDALPYTPEFDRLCAAVRTTVGAPHDEPRTLLHRLHTLRKAGRLPKLGAAADKPPRIDAAHEAVLVELVTELAGSLGQRDRLPHTPAFDDLAERFRARTGLDLARRDLWRIIARLAK
jgi:cephalosporin-C deacetylase-like acetyl esterase